MGKSYVMTAEDVDTAPRCCVCGGPFANDEPRNLRATNDGSVQRSWAWHPHCGPITMIFEDRW